MSTTATVLMSQVKRTTGFASPLWSSVNWPCQWNITSGTNNKNQHALQICCPFDPIISNLAKNSNMVFKAYEKWACLSQQLFRQIKGESRSNWITAFAWKYINISDDFVNLFPREGLWNEMPEGFHNQSIQARVACSNWIGPSFGTIGEFQTGDLIEGQQIRLVYSVYWIPQTGRGLLEVRNFCSLTCHCSNESPQICTSNLTSIGLRRLREKERWPLS